MTLLHLFYFSIFCCSLTRHIVAGVDYSGKATWTTNPCKKYALTYVHYCCEIADSFSYRQGACGCVYDNNVLCKPLSGGCSLRKADRYLDAGVHQSLWQADGITGLLDVCPFLSVSLCDSLDCGLGGFYSVGYVSCRLR